MSCKISRFSVLTLVLLFNAIVFSSCQKFSGDQTVPAYIRIDSISITTNYEEQGAPTHNITDAWVYINNEAIGAYELPAVFPVLARGITEVRVDPGIELNGIAGLRSPYPYDNLVFVWMEDFEDPSISLDSTTKSLTDISRTQPANNPEAFIAAYSKYSGLMLLDEDKYLIDVATNVGNNDGFILPQVGEYVFLELDYKNNNYFTTGFYVKEMSQIIQHPMLNMNHSSEWNKIYVNLTPGVSSQVGAIDFNIFFGAFIESGVEEPRILIDNIKLIHRKQ